MDDPSYAQILDGNADSNGAMLNADRSKCAENRISDNRKGWLGASFSASMHPGRLPWIVT